MEQIKTQENSYETEDYSSDNNSSGDNSTESTNNTSESNENNKRYNPSFTLIFLLLGGLFIYNNHLSTPCNLFVPENKTKINEVIQVTNWWQKYNSECCISLRVNNFALDCSADSFCYIYLHKWLLNFNQTFGNSVVSKKCCYSYRPFGSKLYTNHCSFQCLNTQKSLLNY